MATEVSITNFALRMVGEEGISSLSEETKQASVCRELFPLCLDEALERYSWTFAQKRVVIAQDGTAPAFGYAYRYQKPSDCVAIIQMNEDKNTIYAQELRFILSDEDECKLKYTSRITDMTILPAAFANALAALLASKIVYNFSGGKRKADELMALYTTTINIAFIADRKYSIGVDEETELSMWEGSWVTRV